MKNILISLPPGIRSTQTSIGSIAPLFSHLRQLPCHPINIQYHKQQHHKQHQQQNRRCNLYRTFSSSSTSTSSTSSTDSHGQSAASDHAFSSSSSSSSSSLWASDFATNAITISPIQRVLLAGGSAVLGFLDPHRGDMIAVLGETTGACAAQHMMSNMQRSAEGQEILELKPRVDSQSIDMEYLSGLPQNTFGFAYFSFMDSRGYKVGTRTPVRFMEDVEEAYVIQRYREVHDFWHVLTRQHTDVRGEIAQKWLELLQTGLPMTALSAIIGPLRLPYQQKLAILNQSIPWALACNRSIETAVPGGLMGVFYERYFEVDLADLRQQLGVLIPVAEEAGEEECTPGMSQPRDSNST